mgnify:FL=1
MSGKAKYCEECKGYGGLFVQVIKRYGDDRIKERYPEKPAKENCEPCKGTGMVSVTTDKEPVFEVASPEPEHNSILEDMKELVDIVDDSDEVHTLVSEEEYIAHVDTAHVETTHVETDQEHAERVAEDPGADIDVPSEAPEPSEDEPDYEEEVVDEDDPVVFEETPVEGSEGEMPL